MAMGKLLSRNKARRHQLILTYIERVTPRQSVLEQPHELEVGLALLAGVLRQVHVAPQLRLAAY